MRFPRNPKITVVGLGYVGLPLAVALADRFDTIGIDIDAARIDELRRGYDRTHEITAERLVTSKLALSSHSQDGASADVYIVTVPTPVDEHNQPDLQPVISASRTVANLLDPSRPTVVVYESTVYPGVTEDVCGPLLEVGSGLRRGQHFWLGYSPERINPGDKEHTVDRITKVVAGENPEVTQLLSEIYSSITTGGVFPAASIKTAEAAKVIENAQRDINIAFMNEIATIFSKVGVSIWDVLEASETKWNFLPFKPGLVGGHCIGVDPYYLSHLAQQLGHQPEVILAGRKINDGMACWIANEISREAAVQNGRVLVLGVTFKENVPDIRNSKVVDLVSSLRRAGHDVDIADPVAEPSEVLREYQIPLQPSDLPGSYDIVVGAVAHEPYVSLTDEKLQALVKQGGLLADLKGMWRSRSLAEGVARWTL